MRAPPRSPGEKNAWSTPGGTISIRPGSAPYSDASWAASAVHEARIASEQPITAASASTRRSGSGSPVSALTRARVWKVDTSGRSSCVLDGVAGHPREPVVGVDGVDVAHRLDVGQHRRGVLVDDVGQRLLGKLGRTGVDVDDPESGLDVDHVGQPVLPPPHVHHAADTGLGQRADQLPHIDVHPTAVARAGLDERRRVQ